MNIFHRIVLFLEKYLNFYRVHFLFFLTATLIGSLIFWLIETQYQTVNYIDSLFLCKPGKFNLFFFLKIFFVSKSNLCNNCDRSLDTRFFDTKSPQSNLLSFSCFCWRICLGNHFPSYCKKILPFQTYQGFGTNGFKDNPCSSSRIPSLKQAPYCRPFFHCPSCSCSISYFRLLFSIFRSLSLLVHWKRYKLVVLEFFPLHLCFQQCWSFSFLRQLDSFSTKLFGSLRKTILKN
jgi:hypothetical protein